MHYDEYADGTKHIATINHTQHISLFKGPNDLYHTERQTGATGETTNAQTST